MDDINGILKLMLNCHKIQKPLEVSKFKVYIDFANNCSNIIIIALTLKQTEINIHFCNYLQVFK